MSPPKHNWWERRPPTPENPVLCFVSQNTEGELDFAVRITEVLDYDPPMFLGSSRHVYQRAEPVAPIDQYTYWPGGECPVLPDTVVDVILRQDIEKLNVAAKNVSWEHWSESYDIIAYRVHVED